MEKYHFLIDNLGYHIQRLFICVLEVNFGQTDFLIGLNDHVSDYQPVRQVLSLLRFLELKVGVVKLTECQLADLAVLEFFGFFLPLLVDNHKAIELFGFRSLEVKAWVFQLENQPAFFIYFLSHQIFILQQRFFRLLIDDLANIILSQGSTKLQFYLVDDGAD